MNETLINRYHEARVADSLIKFGDFAVAQFRAFGQWLSTPATDADPVADLLARAEAYDGAQSSYAADLRAAAYAHQARNAQEGV